MLKLHRRTYLYWQIEYFTLLKKHTSGDFLLLDISYLHFFVRQEINIEMA